MTLHLRHRRAFIMYVIAMIGMFLAGFAGAQQAGRGNRGGQFPAAQRASQFLDRMTQSLSDVAASEEQHKKIDPIMDDARQRLKGLVQDLIPEQPIVRRTRLVQFLTDVQEKVLANLSKEQGESFQTKVGDFQQELVGNFAARSGRGGSASQPTMGQDGQQQRLGTVVERLRDYLNQVDLTDSQKNEVDTLFADTRKKLQDIQQAQCDANSQQQVIQYLRQELGAILTSQQLDRLRTAVNQGAGAMAMNQPAANAPGDAAVPGQAGKVEIPMIDVGQAAPDFSLKRIDGSLVQLSKLNGRLVLIVFGSYSSPSFRDRAGSLEKINRDYANGLVTMVIYTRENHPIGDDDVDRNKAENVSVEQPADMNGRITLAKEARSALKVNFPILIDTIDDATAKAYGGFTNAAYLIGRDGHILARQKWFEPYAMRADIDEALNKSPQ